MSLSTKGSLLIDTSHVPASAWTLDDLGAAVRAGRHRTYGDDSYAESRRLEVEAVEQEQMEQEHRVQDAHAAGYTEGRLAGELEEGMRLRHAVTATEAALATIQENEAQWQNGMEANIAALAVAVARHVIGHELRVDPTTVAELVKRALAEFPIDQSLRVRVNPIDLSMLSTYTTPSGEPIAIAPNRDVHWLADARIQAGGCVVEGRERIVDGRVDTALERLYRKLSGTDA